MYIYIFILAPPCSTILKSNTRSLTPSHFRLTLTSTSQSILSVIHTDHHGPIETLNAIITNR